MFRTTIYSFVFGVILTVPLLTPAAFAQSLGEVTGPAEQPPANYTARQYIDSRGCVFIRTGFGGRTNWVPRVNRNREVFCSPSNTPSLSNSQLSALRQAAPAQAAASPAITPPAPRVPPVAAATASTRPSQSAPVVTTNRITQRQTLPQASQVVIHATPQVVRRRSGTVPFSVVTPGAQMSRSAPVRTGYSRTTGTIPFNTQPTAVRRQAPIVANAPQPIIQLADPIHNLPIHNATIDPDVTARGDAQMNAIWTQTVPRRLITDGQRVRRAGAQEQRVRYSEYGRPLVQAQPSYQKLTSTSARNAPAPAVTAPRASSGHYLQVGSFSHVQNAQAMISHFAAYGHAGIIRPSRGLNVVLIGPFSSQSAAQEARSIAHQKGLTDAFFTR